MKNTTEFKNFIREPFCFPGGYKKIMLAADGGCICHNCAKDNFKLILKETRTGWDDQWFFNTCFVNWEGEFLTCDHCGATLDPEYQGEGAA